MKKSIIAMLVVFIIAGLTGCNNSMNDIIENEASITGIVTDVRDKYIQIYIENEGYPYGADCDVSLDVKNEDGIYGPINVGDEVVVYYDGSIQESDPMRIATVYAITLQTPAVRESGYKQISMDEAVAMMEKETDYIILDVRTPQEYEEKHIPNAINIPNETIGDDIISELPQKDQMILVYCRSGNRSKQASEKLAALGYTNVYEFGGINDWKGELVDE